MSICTDCCVYGKMIDSANLIQGIRRLVAENRWPTIPRPCPAKIPTSNNFITIIKARLGRITRRWRR